MFTHFPSIIGFSSNDIHLAGETVGHFSDAMELFNYILIFLHRSHIKCHSNIFRKLHRRLLQNYLLQAYWFIYSDEFGTINELKDEFH